MKKVKYALSIVLAVVILYMCFIPTLAQEYNVQQKHAEKKISQSLLDVLSNKENEIIPAFVFLKGCDKAPVFDALQEKFHYNVEAYEDYNRYESEIVPNVDVNGKTVSELLDGEEYSREIINLDNKESPIDISVRREINAALVNNANTYLRHYREEMKELTSGYVGDFLEECKDSLNSIIKRSDVGEFIIANIYVDKIRDIACNPIVESLDYFEDKIVENYSWNAMEMTEADSVEGLGSYNYNSGLGYDGDGVNIGVIEASCGCYNAANYNLTDAQLEYTDLGTGISPTISDHATNVVSLICGKKTVINGKTYEGAATGSNVYQTGITYSHELFDAIEGLVEQKNVDVINYSAGNDFGLIYDSYSQAVDSYIENYRISFVKSAGNNSSNITSPGKAYNAITVGNLQTKDGNNGSLTAPFYMSSMSSYAEESYLANKPDVVAPGKHLYLPDSSSTVVSIGSGTSYSAPIVTGMVAQLMQYDEVAIYNPNCAKNHIVCGASNNDIAGVNYTGTNNQFFTDQSGTGLVNAVNTYASTGYSNKYFSSYSWRQTAPTQYKTIASLSLHRRDHFRAVLTFEKEEDIPLTSAYGNNLDIRLVRNNPYSTFLKCSETTTNNVELIDTYIENTGTYWLQIRMKNSILDENTNYDLHYWVSWRVY